MAAVAAERNLLFGLLAMQNGLINQVQLVAAFQAWTLDKARALADHFISLGHLSEPQRAVVEAMADLHVAKYGDVERSLAAVAAGRSTRERLARLGDPDIGSTLGHVGSVHGSTEDGGADRTTSYAVGTATSDGQRFRVLRPHARGGLGAVFVALDTELHREVALKQILEQYADDLTSRQRFLMEAEITGGLEHPGIVPVYGLGTYDGGRPYYAMRFIKGDSLKEAIDRFHADAVLKSDPGRRSLELRKLLRRFTDVCNAIEYAHSRGVLHRDLKPGNIIVGKHGETLVVDWGLAKALGRGEPWVDSGERTLIPSPASGSAETLPGSALGTPAYMSPEQAEGDIPHLGPRSDVYSLGATLYYLLTGQPPVEGDIGEVLRAVQRGEFFPPRRHDPNIDPALEAVCLKAMAHELADRYGSPKALAEDTERWMADEPVTAWREPASIRARRWMRRHRTAVTAASAAVLVAIVGLAGVLAVQSRANTRLESKNKELDKANKLKDEANIGLVEANGRVQARFDLAREAIRSFQQGVNEDDMLKGKELEALRNKLLRSAAEFYEKLEKLLQGRSDRPSRAILAQSYFELGELTEKIGIKPEALAVHRKALAIRRELAKSPEGDAGAMLDVARSLVVTGKLAQSTGDNVGALSSLQEARGLAERLAAPPGATDAARDVLGTSHRRIGIILLNTGKSPEAVESFRRALAICQELADANPATTDFRGSLADSHNEIGRLQQKAGEMAEALESYRKALAIRRLLADANPDITDLRTSLADSYNNIGFLQSQTGQPAEALESYRRALEIRQKLAVDNPAVTIFQDRLAFSHDNIGFLHSRNGRPDAAMESYRRALAIRQKLAEGHPSVPEFRSGLADIHNEVGTQLSQTGQPVEAMKSYRRALEIRQTLADDNPTVTEFRSRLAIGYNNIGILQNRIGQPAAALESHRRALEIRQKLFDDDPTIPEYGHYLANSHANSSEILRGLGRLDEARDGYVLAIAIRDRLVKANPTVALYRFHLAANVRGLGLVKAATGDLAGAVTDARHALALYEGLPSRSGWELYDMACVRSTLSALASQGAPGTSAGEAGPEAVQAMDLLRGAVAEGYRDAHAMRSDSELDSLRSRVDFQLLMMDLAFPADPFVVVR
jgi:serine/threonine-protein kinase